MNICIFAKSSPAHRMGGMEIHGDLLSRGLAARGHRVVVITTSHPAGLVSEEEEGVQTWYLPDSPGGVYSRQWWRGSVAKFIELARGIDFDVVISQSVAAYAYCRKLKKGRSLPVVSVMQGTPLGELRSVWNQVATPLELVPFLVKTLPYSLFIFSRWFRRTVGASDAIVAASYQLADDLRKEFPSAAERLTTVLNGVDTCDFCPDGWKRNVVRGKWGIGADEKVVLMAGRLDKQKGMDDGLRAFARSRSFLGRGKLVVVGEGPFRAALERLARSLGIDADVLFIGCVTHREMACYYNACDLFLNPTRRIEGLPFVIAEVMACGRPVVSTKIGGIPSAIEDGIDGFLVPPGDIQAMASKLLTLMVDEELCASIGERARGKAMAALDVRKMVGETLVVLTQAGRRPSSTRPGRRQPWWGRWRGLSAGP